MRFDVVGLTCRMKSVRVESRFYTEIISPSSSSQSQRIKYIALSSPFLIKISYILSSNGTVGKVINSELQTKDLEHERTVMN